MKRERRQPTPSEGHVLPFPQKRPVGKLVTEGEAPVLWEAEDIESHVIHELRGARLPVIHLDAVQVPGSHGCRLGTVAGVYFTSIHGPLSTNSSGVEERGHPPSGPFFEGRVTILRRLTDESKAR
jgi:hypothetical protein